MKKIRIKDNTKIKKKIRFIKSHIIFLQKRSRFLEQKNQAIHKKITVRILIREWYQELKYIQQGLIQN